MGGAELQDRVMVVVGGAGGIGDAICSRLTRSGAQVYSLDLQASSERTVESITCDVRDPASVAAAVRKVEMLTRRLDALVYCAGVTRDSVIWKMRVEDWDTVQAVNLRGAFLSMQAAIPIMRSAGHGSIVLIGSINGSRGKFGTSAYSASKAGLLGLAKSVARETGRFSITVNVIEPGMVRTAMTDALPQEALDKAAAETLMGELVAPEDV
ncbi:MAG TPA: SDR family NAD(P)-dependent oxidoreductase, partial [Gammaproteobacteria bacterium]|nr:SDR family NAD(P)-dependent oxidoreductase [Gammaproteobacteria bacterium]